MSTHNSLTPAEKADGWRLLFDGRTLDGWQPTHEPWGWEVEDGTIYCLGKRQAYLATTGQFENYVLSMEFRIDPGANSGVFLRWSDLADPVHTGLEVQILDSYGADVLKTNTCGAIYGLAAPSDFAVKAPGEWNHFLITVQGPIITVRLNDKAEAQMDVDRWTEAGKNPDGTKNSFKYAWKDMPRRGHIGFQDYGDKVWFRNIKIKELD